ncbi:MAG: PAS domain S-box protein [Deltaproteobacteria bacterium]|nr:PAS domain S-box protein [Deltaproteobacteria bacterium]
MIVEDSAGRQLLMELNEAKDRLAEAERTIEAMRQGDVDALIVSRPGGKKIYAEQGADHTYRLLIEQMSEGAAILNTNGLILYSNHRLGGILRTSISKITGSSFRRFVAPEDSRIFETLLQKAGQTSAKGELELKAGDGIRVPAYVSMNPLRMDDKSVFLGMVVTDLTEQKRNEQILSEEKLSRSIIEQAAEPLVVCNPDGLIMRASAMAAQLCRQDPMYQPFDIVFPLNKIVNKNACLIGEESNETRLPYSSIVEGAGNFSGLEAVLKLPDDQEFFFVINANNILNKEGTFIGCVISMTDITSRKMMEESLQRNEIKFRELFNNINVGVTIFETNSEGRDFIIKEMNQAREYIEKIHKDKLLDKSFAQTFSYDVPSGLLDVFERVWKTGRPEHYNRNLYEDGKAVSWRENYIYKLPSGQLVLICNDVTEKKKLNQELSKWSHIVNDVEWGVAVESADGLTLEMVNPAFAKMHGFTTDELVGRPISYLFDQGSNNNLSLNLDISELRGYYSFESKNVRKDKSAFPVLVSVTTVKGEQGRRLYRAYNMIDITDRKEEENQRKKLERQLRQAQKMEAVGTLAGGIAHDFNNILGIIIGYSELSLEYLKTESIDPQIIKNNLDIIVQAGVRAVNLIDQILRFSRKADTGKKPVMLGVILKETIKMLRASLPSTIEIRQEISCPETTIMTDPTQIHQILMNLCTNASHAMGMTPGVLTIRLTEAELGRDDLTCYPDLKPGRFARLSVADTGHGIAPDIIEKIFDPFFTTKEIGKGTGLGLAVIHNITKELGGIIDVDSLIGKGTTFTILLPTARISVKDEKEALTTDYTGSESVLFVDDEKFLAELGKKILNRLGYDVTVATDPLEALSFIRSEPEKFDLVITDYTMPHMTGLEMAKNIKQLLPNMPIILCTGNSESIPEQHTKALGIDVYLSKPVEIDDLMKAVRGVFDTADERTCQK